MSNYLANIFGNKENNYSELFAFTLVYHEELLSWILDYCDIPGNAKIDSIYIEKILDSQENRIDIYLLLDNGFRIGVENKKYAKFTPDQLKRYMESSHFSERKQSRLILLTPSRYSFDKALLNNTVFWLTYNQLINKLSNLKSRDRFIEDLIDYFMEVEMGSITKIEIESMLHYYSANKKLDAALNDIRDENDGNMENNTCCYKLFWRMYGKYLFYIGYRFSNNWYVNYSLLNDKPECIFYLREYDGKRTINENELNVIYNNVFSEIYKIKSTNCEIMNGEVKFIIRKNIEDFSDSVIEDISKWFIDINNILKKSFA